ncbi:hypothetical protein HPB48_012231 [Haemaphysalis longicornis]|uniref:Glycogenin-1 n=1 Tax=Haemaphysalis longicornis TaxID=44386 RepID=A0A9J6GN51_HAELO|nr:hypothetical protein HPB48_012231 [Haemaphysalis longicornis]
MQSQEEVAGLKQSWVTLATNDIYAIGAVVLGYSLREAKTAHKLTVLVNEDVGAVTRHLTGPGLRRDPASYTAECLSLRSIVCCTTLIVFLPCLSHTLGMSSSVCRILLTALSRERAGDEVTCSDTKLHVWRLLHLNKGVFLDADTLVLSNCDDLFDRQELAAAPLRGWPDLFDTGVFVFEPSEKTHAQGSFKADVPPTDEHRRDDVESDEEEYEGLGTFLNIQRLLDAAVKAATPQADEEDDDFPDPASSLDSSFSDNIPDE